MILIGSLLLAPPCVPAGSLASPPSLPLLHPSPSLIPTQFPARPKNDPFSNANTSKVTFVLQPLDTSPVSHRHLFYSLFRGPTGNAPSNGARRRLRRPLRVCLSICLSICTSIQPPC